MIRWLGVALLTVIVALTGLDAYRRSVRARTELAPLVPLDPPLAMAATSPARSEPMSDELVTRRDGILFVNRTAERKYDRALRGSIRGFQERTGIELGIVLVDRLPPEATIESLAVDIVERAKLGGAHGGRGMLFLWSEADRQFKIEVSYELEDVFPDSTCARLESGARTFMLSRAAFARREFLTELVVTMGLHWLEYQRTGRAGELVLPFEPGGFGLSERFLTGGAGVVGRGYAATAEAIAKEVRALESRQASNALPDASVAEVVRRYRESLAGGIGDPRLPLLTEGSRFYRHEQPHGAGWLRRVHAYQEKALPYTLIEHGDLAAAVFRPGHPVLPILLRRDASGLWRVDEAGAWAHFHLFELGDNPVLKYFPSPYAFAWSESGHRKATTPMYTRRATAPAAAPVSGIVERLARAERALEHEPRSVARLVELADILHFEMYWLEAAAPIYERAVEIERGRDDLRWRLVDVYMNTTEVDGMERTFRQLLERTGDPMAKSYLDTMKRWYW